MKFKKILISLSLLLSFLIFFSCEESNVLEYKTTGAKISLKVPEGFGNSKNSELFEGTITIKHDGKEIINQIMHVKEVEDGEMYDVIDVIEVPYGEALDIVFKGRYNSINYIGEVKDQVFEEGMTTTIIVELRENNGNITPNGMVAYYPFNGNANDESGNGHNGTSNGATLTTDRFGNENSAMSFDGDNTIILPEIISTYFTAPTYSFSFFYKRTGENNNSSGNDWQRIVYCEKILDIFTLMNPGGVEVEPNSLYVNIPNNGTSNKFYIGEYRELNKFFHFTLVKDENQLKVYIDGVLVKSESINYPISSIHTKIELGSINGQNGLVGSIDDIRIYNKALSESEINALYHEGGWNGNEPEGELVAYYPFNGDANDESGNGNNGEVNGATLTIDRFGNENSAMIFDGVDDHIAVSNSISLDPKDQITLFAWVKPDIVKDDVSILSNSSYPSSGYELWQSTPSEEGVNKVRFTFRSYNSIENVINTSKDYSINEFHLIVATYIKSDGVLKLYVDGILDSILEDNTSGLVTPVQDLWIGGWSSSPTSRHFSGIIDDIRIYNKALSETEINALYHEGGWTGNEPEGELVAYYPFNGNANDESGNDNDGTNNGAMLTTDRFGNENSAMSFDGVDDFVETSDYTDRWDNWSTSIWFRTNSENSFQIMLGRELQGIYNDFEIHYNPYGNNKLLVETDGSQNNQFYSISEISSNKWCSLIATYDGVSKKIYINGTLDNQQEDNDALIDLVAPLLIGRHPGENGRYFDGKLDDIRIYNKALTEIEINDLYHEDGWTGNEPEGELVAYYPFNGNANDESGNDNDGTNNGATLTTDRFGNENSAMSFDGVDDFVDLEANFNYPNELPYSISIWAKCNDTIGRYNLFSKYISHDNDGFMIEYQNEEIRTYFSGNFEFVPFYANLYHHVVTIVNGEKIKTYIDNSLVSTVTDNFSNASSTANTIIGAVTNDDTNNSLFRFFHGTLDDIRIYNKTLSEAEINDLYHEGGWTGNITPGEMVLVEGGTFQMGDHFNEGDSDELPLHQVTVSSFYIGKYEITQGEYETAIGSNPSNFVGDNNPVESVTWYNAVAYCNALSVSEGLSQCYSINGSDVSCDFTKKGYRLPTEAEWEYAARGGKHHTDDYRYAGCHEEADLGSYAWYDPNSDSQTHEVGTKSANQLGIHDMSGNVWEWCNDWYGSYTSDNQTNPTGPVSGAYRMHLGGSWNASGESCRLAHRSKSSPSNSSGRLGFRVVRPL